MFQFFVPKFFLLVWSLVWILCWFIPELFLFLLKKVQQQKKLFQILSLLSFLQIPLIINYFIQCINVYVFDSGFMMIGCYLDWGILNLNQLFQGFEAVVNSWWDISFFFNLGFFNFLVFPYSVN